MAGSSPAGRATQGGKPEQPRPRGSKAPGIPEPKNIAVMLQGAYLDTLLVPFFAVVGCMRPLVGAPGFDSTTQNLAARRKLSIRSLQTWS